MIRKPIKKKGTIELQFNWLFVLIVGAMILLFFFGLIRTLSKNSKESLNFDILSYLDEILAGVGVSSNTEYSINLPGAVINIDCYFMTIEGSDFEGKSVESRVVFGPNRISREMTTYTLFWGAPFNTAYFLYVTSSKNKYLIVEDADGFMQKVHDDASSDDLLPLNINIETYSDLTAIENDFENQNFNKIKIITFREVTPDTMTLNLKKIKNKDVSAIRIIPDTSITIDEFPDGTGAIEFYTFDGTGFTLDGESKYLNKASLAGAIYSENKEMYDCNMDKAYERLNKIAEILLKKTATLLTEDVNTNQCDTDPSPQHNYNRINAILEDLTDPLISVNPIDIYSKEQELNEKNKKLQAQSCPIIY